MKRSIAFLTVIFLLTGLLAGCGLSRDLYEELQKNYDELKEKYEELLEKTADDSTDPADPSDPTIPSNPTDPTDDPTDPTEDSTTDAGKPLGYMVEMVIADYGTIKLQLARTAAPITVDNFVKLVNEGFYDGLTFHRIIEGFMMQGGDPQGNGYGGSDEEIYGEFASNGWNNPISHTRGVISMARSYYPNTASSQFFIMHEDYTGLDGSYAAFGWVTEGMEVVDAICESAQPIDDNGTIPASAQPVIESITIVDVLMPE